MSNSCKLCPTFFSSGAKKIPGVFAPLRPPLVTALLLRVACAPAVRQAENVPVFVAQKGHSHKKAIRTHKRPFEVGRNSSVRFDDCSLNVVQDASERLDGHVAAATGVPGLRAAPGLVKQFGSHLHADVIKNTLDL